MRIVENLIFKLSKVTAVALVVLLLSHTNKAALAQIKGATKPSKSFSSKSGGDTHKSAVSAIIADTDVADAIAADALNGLFKQADEHYDRGEWNHSLNLNRVVEAGDPHNVECYGNSALLLWSSDRGQEAIDQLKLGIANNPDSSFMYDELGTHYWIRLKDANNAVPYYEKAIQYKCGWTTYHNLAFCYQKLGRWESAVKTWKQATKFGDDIRAPILLKQAEAHLKK
jgi:tetratricopeptide (TPR) repeat protein